MRVNREWISDADAYCLDLRYISAELPPDFCVSVWSIILHFLFASHLYDNDDMHLPVHSWNLFTPFPCRSIVNYGATILRIDQMLCQMRCPSVISVINQSLATPSFLLFLLFSFVNKSKWKCTPVIQTPVERSKKGGIFLDEPVWFGSLLPN